MKAEDIRTIEEIIQNIKVNKPNLDHISSTGIINGSLFLDIKRAMEGYANQKVDKAIKLATPLIIEQQCGIYESRYYQTDEDISKEVKAELNK